MIWVPGTQNHALASYPACQRGVNRPPCGVSGVHQCLWLSSPQRYGYWVTLVLQSLQMLSWPSFITSIYCMCDCIIPQSCNIWNGYTARLTISPFFPMLVIEKGSCWNKFIGMAQMEVKQIKFRHIFITKRNLSEMF